MLLMAGKGYLQVAQALEAIVGSQALHQKGSSLGKGPAGRHPQQLNTTSTIMYWTTLPVQAAISCTALIGAYQEWTLLGTLLTPLMLQRAGAIYQHCMWCKCTWRVSRELYLLCWNIKACSETAKAAST